MDQEWITALLTELGDHGDGEYTEREEKAVQQVLKFVQDDQDLKVLSRYFTRNLAISPLRACELDAAIVINAARAFYHFFVKKCTYTVLKINPLKLREALECGVFKILKRSGKTDPTVILFRIGYWRPKDFNIEEILAFGTLIMLYITKSSPDIQKSGFMMIQDMVGFKISHALHLSRLDFLRAGYTFLRGSIPFQICRGIVFVRGHRLFEKTFNAMQWIFPSELMRRIHMISSDMNNMSKFIPRTRLPKEYGGLLEDENGFDESYQELLNIPDLIPGIQYLISAVLETAGL